jgi:dodecin
MINRYQIKRSMKGENKMAIVKVIEILAESKEGWEAATKDAVKEAAKTIKNIRSVYVENMQAVVDDDKVVSYRINAKISFVVD